MALTLAPRSSNKQNKAMSPLATEYTNTAPVLMSPPRSSSNVTKLIWFSPAVTPLPHATDNDVSPFCSRQQHKHQQKQRTKWEWVSESKRENAKEINQRWDYTTFVCVYYWVVHTEFMALMSAPRSSNKVIMSTLLVPTASNIAVHPFWREKHTKTIITQ